VVGYGAVVFTGSPRSEARAASEPLKVAFSDQTGQELISMARSAVKAAVEGSWVTYDPTDNPELQVRTGCFVTLKNNGKLRGCIGRFTSEAPLWRLVREMAVSSATRDRRFAADPIKPSEVQDLDVEISVLFPPRKVTDPLKEIMLGRDGIIVRDKGRSGTFLPQVATETGWNLEEFLGHCARDKAGLTWEGWKSPTAEVFAYTATIIRERK
jgi:AmmeMemoRadiSam system protein A